jgi:carbamoylphosphate synthase large subunit
MAATLLLHDRAVIEASDRKKKIREDFEKNGMVLPGHRLTFIGDRPVAIPLDAPLVVKNPYAAVRFTGV